MSKQSSRKRHEREKRQAERERLDAKKAAPQVAPVATTTPRAGYQQVSKENPYRRLTTVVMVASLVIFGVEGSVVVATGEDLLIVFMVTAVLVLVALWLAQRKVRTWEIEHGNQG